MSEALPAYEATATVCDAAPPSSSRAATAAAAAAARAYLQRWRGVPGRRPPPLPSWPEVALASSASFIGIALVAALHYELLTPDLTMLIGSFGATAVLLYAAPAAALSQPRNVLGGHVLSALVGVAVRVAVVEQGRAPQWVGCAAAVALAVGAMQCTGTLHPPGGATALLAVTGDAAIRRLGFLYAALPAAAGAALMTAVALLVGNVREGSRYPQYWW